MGMRPGVLCHLEKGKLIDSQDGFVDTFNWIVDFCNNLKGDGQTSPTGAIEVDKNDSAHPVVKLKKGGGGGSITVYGTDGTHASGDSLTIKAGNDTNLQSSVTKENGKVVVSIDVYYK